MTMRTIRFRNLARAAWAIGIALVLGQSASAQIPIMVNGFPTYSNGYGVYGMGSNYFMTSPGFYGPLGGNVYYGLGVNNLGGYGVNNLAWGNNYGVNWGTGMINPYVGAYGESPYSMIVAPASVFQAAANRYNFLDQDAAENYEALQLFEQTGIAANQQSPGVKVIEVRPGQGTTTSAGTTRHHVLTFPALSRDKLLDAQGKVRWPAAVVDDPNLAAVRDAAGTAVQNVYKEWRGQGRASAQSAQTAQAQLAAFYTKSFDLLRRTSPADAVGVEVFIKSLELQVAQMAAIPPNTNGVINVPRRQSATAPATNSSPATTPAPRRPAQVIRPPQ